MTTTLTEEMRQALEAQKGEPIAVVDPVTRRTYILLAEEAYAKVRNLLAAERSSEPTAPQSQLDNEVPEGILCSQKAYWRDLPQLLKMKSRRHEWVAYHREERIGLGKSLAELHHECLRRGIPDDEFYVGRLEPQALPPWESEEFDVSGAFLDWEEEPNPERPGNSKE